MMIFSYNLDPNFWIAQLTQWQHIAMIITAICLLISIIDKPKWRALWYDHFHFKLSLLVLASFGVSIFFFREWFFTSYPKIELAFPQFTWPEHLVIWASQTHLRSIMFFAAMIFWLWRKFDRLLPALAVGWFALAAVELSFIPDMLLDPAVHGFLGWSWYLPFVATMPLFLFAWREFHFPKGFWIWLAAAVFVQYFLLIWRPWGLTIWFADYGLSWSSIWSWIGNGQFLLNSAVLMNPPWQTWWFEFLNHLMKSLFAVAFCYVVWRPKKV